MDSSWIKNHSFRCLIALLQHQQISKMEAEMHDLDQTLNAAEYEMDDYEMGDFEEEYDEEFEEEYEAFDAYEFEGVFDEAEEMDLAAELLTVSDEYEMEQFIGNLIKKAGRKIRKFAKSSTGRALGGILKKVAGKALPIVGRAAGTFLGGPAGGAIGGKLASAAGKAFGLELEGLSPEDQEFEVARRFVRLAGDAAKKAAQLPGNTPANKAAMMAVKSAAKKHAPGLLSQAQNRRPGGGRMSSGKWIRRGRKIILMGV